jgi:D-3-phosphoglycerate dehydrogenase
MSKKILLTETIHESGIEQLNNYDVTITQCSGQNLADEIIDCDGIIVRTQTLSGTLLERAAKLQVIGRYGAGYDNIDVKKCNAQGIMLVNVPCGNTTSVAEYVIGAMILLSRKFIQCDSGIRNNHWKQARLDNIGYELSNKVLGIVGFGHIGKAIGHKAVAAFNMKVLVYDPFVPAVDTQQDQIQLVQTLDELLGRSDYVTLHLPLNDNTRGIINYGSLMKMKKSAFLINAARGGIIVEADLSKALNNGLLAGACLDVLASEPPLPSLNILKMDNVIFTPHIAGLTQESESRIATTVVQQVMKVLNGEKPDFLVNSDVLALRKQ